MNRKLLKSPLLAMIAILATSPAFGMGKKMLEAMGDLPLCSLPENSKLVLKKPLVLPADRQSREFFDMDADTIVVAKYDVSEYGTIVSPQGEHGWGRINISRTLPQGTELRTSGECVDEGRGLKVSNSWIGTVSAYTVSEFSDRKEASINQFIHTVGDQFQIVLPSGEGLN